MVPRCDRSVCVRFCLQGRYEEAAAKGEAPKTKDPKTGVMQDMPVSSLLTRALAELSSVLAEPKRRRVSSPLPPLPAAD